MLWTATKLGGMRTAQALLAVAITLCVVLSARAEVRVQDIAHLQGQRTNKLLGFGLVVGLKGTGDAGVYPNTARALQKMHERFVQPVFDLRELKANTSVAIVTVEAVVPENGAHEGQNVDVVVSVIGSAKSLEGGQLLPTPLQESMLSLPDIFAIAGGRIELTDPKSPTRGLVRGGGTFERDVDYAFVSDGAITLLLDDPHAGIPMAQMVARAINHEITNPAQDDGETRAESGVVVVQSDIAVVTSSGAVRVRIPQYEQTQPAGFITRVLQTQLFVLPQQVARVSISKSRHTIVMSGSVTISPTILHIKDVGTLQIGGGAPAGGQGGGAASAKNTSQDVVGLDTDKTGGVEFQELLDTLSRIKLSQEQMADAVEQLYRSGALHAQLVYTE